MRLLEERLGIRLLARTTRNVSPTEAGERLMRPSHHISRPSVPAWRRWVTCATAQLERYESHARMIPWRPSSVRGLPDSGRIPDITLEFYGLRVVEQRSMRASGSEAPSKDMVAVRVGRDWRLVVVGSPDYREVSEAEEACRHYAPPLHPHPTSPKRCHLCVEFEEKARNSPCAATGRWSSTA